MFGDLWRHVVGSSGQTVHLQCQCRSLRVRRAVADHHLFVLSDSLRSPPSIGSQDLSIRQIDAEQRRESIESIVIDGREELQARTEQRHRAIVSSRRNEFSQHQDDHASEIEDVETDRVDR